LARVPGYGLPQALVPKPAAPCDQAPPTARPLRLALERRLPLPNLSE
jgi:hypothetical protein